ncbi:putative damage-inducible protein DinB [Dyadobacter sp. BE34]|uniref:Damage-inducible protein DinB n=1 Tax=Dyadobacter fermentans TaxID=94254 RepID=A0ABU1R0X7_9BACT|nr:MULTISPECIES: DinB family protein [Dyadobacter]MBO9612247.1 DinB family protein [Dyadobacter sp.]MDR6807061.1 putative damage-inducible protein DinB [Dyadobacter fermentans]MDR7044802.1 putative damage-inducible protein DinB [Dyadobacter sp. BE242]MDR7199462.1 putative damage-inducible protein DinB [Dyadobacter sp. BE34]MDR7217422.1 putative damage-inducible protein DinB [Dyadobacter sp. BE31]
MEAKEEILRIIDVLNDTYESEEAWYGPSVVEALRDVTPKIAEARLSSNTHSIAEIVYHMTTWRIFAVRKLQGDAEFDIKTQDKDWKKFPVVDEFEWEAIQMELSLSQEELVSELEKIEDDSFLEEFVPGRDYSYYTLIHGVIQHDVYHAGQIGLIKKAAKAMRLEEDDDYGAYGDRSDYDNSADYY